MQLGIFFKEIISNTLFYYFQLHINNISTVFFLLMISSNSLQIDIIVRTDVAEVIKHIIEHLINYYSRKDSLIIKQEITV